jgi:hypothetical protein
MTRELTIEELQQRWCWLYWELGIEDLLVTEIKSTGSNKSFIVNGLTMELEKDFAMCQDTCDIIVNNVSTLRFFFAKNVTSIKIVPYKDWYREILTFNDCIVFIEKVA